jgi:predicted nicotinamide N-methyase
MMDLDATLADRTVRDLSRRFGLRWVEHRIGELRLRFAEIRDVDPCVSALYPECLVDHGDAPVWMISWPAAFGLAEYLVHELGVKDGAVLELGCGTAVVGVVAAAAGARVLCTDYDEIALCVARHNLLHNGLRGARLSLLDWYAGEVGEQFPLVVGSEITYHNVAFEPLLGVLQRSVAPGGTVVLSDIFRKQTDAFLDLARGRGWRVETHRRMVHLAMESHAIRIAVLQRR